MDYREEDVRQYLEHFDPNDLGSDPNDPKSDPNDPNEPKHDSAASNDGFGERITERQLFPLQALRGNGGATYDELARLVASSPASVKRDLKTLKKLGLIERVGSTRGHWRVC